MAQHNPQKFKKISVKLECPERQAIQEDIQSAPVIETSQRLCRLCVCKEEYGETFEEILVQSRIAAQIFSLSGVQVI